MPPHCDTRDGPVITAARRALETRNVNFALIWVPESAEEELKEAFEKALRVRQTGTDAQELADEWFFETTVRLHRAGEGAPYTGLKPAGLDWGPVVPRAEEAIETGDATDAIGFVLHTVEDDLQQRFNHVMAWKNYDVNDVKAGREFVQAYIGFVVYAHHLYGYVMQGQQSSEGGGHHHA
jgi:hypothetical protein